MLPSEEDADLPAFCRALGVPGLADIHTHFLRAVCWENPVALFAPARPDTSGTPHSPRRPGPQQSPG